jgi:hypothetical protein
VRIERATFLALVSAIGCNGGQAPLAPGSVVEIPPQPPQPPPSTAPAPPPKPPVPVAVADAATEEEEEPRSVCGWVDPATVTRPPGVCSDDKGTPAACSTMKDCGGTAFPRLKCEAYRRYLKPRVAQHAVACLAKIPGGNDCDSCPVYRCGEEALKTACDDATVDPLCLQITSKCKAVSMAECRSYLSGMNAVGRAKLAGCLSSQPGCGFGIMSCTEGLL